MPFHWYIKVVRAELDIDHYPEVLEESLGLDDAISNRDKHPLLRFAVDHHLSLMVG